MIAFLRTRLGLGCVLLFLGLMAGLAHRVVRREPERAGPPRRATTAVVPANAAQPPEPETAAAPPTVTAAPKKQAPAGRDTSRAASVPAAGTEAPPPAAASLQETLTSLDHVSRLAKQSRADRDRSGQPVTRRKTASPAARVEPVRDAEGVPSGPSPSPALGAGLRLLGRSAHAAEPAAPSPVADVLAVPGPNADPSGPAAPAAADRRRDTGSSPATATAPSPQPLSREGAAQPRVLTRFLPYGHPIKCELVFTLDSTQEETPLVALVVEPVYNNGQLVLPAGTELHGRARPDRLRDRIFSAREWMLVLPREGAQPNGRQLPVVGYALDRAEPAGTGHTWGITDGSFGLQGEVLRTMHEAELRQFAASFVAAGALTLQERQGSTRSNRQVLNTPANAALAGTAANLNQIARQLAEEIERHGVFLRVPAGKQFYFYPQQAIAPERAELPDVALAPAPAAAVLYP